MHLDLRLRSFQKQLVFLSSFYSAAIQLIAPVVVADHIFYCFRLAQVQITASPYGSAKGFCSLLWITPTQLSKLASVKGSTNISAQHEQSADMPLQERSVFMPSLMPQQIYRSEQNSYMTKNFRQYGLVESHLIVLIQLWGQFYDSHQFFCNMTFNDIWVLKFHLQENCHGKEPERNEWL